jgi:hypothetical protein
VAGDCNVMFAGRRGDRVWVRSEVSTCLDVSRQKVIVVFLMKIFYWLACTNDGRDAHVTVVKRH